MMPLLDVHVLKMPEDVLCREQSIEMDWNAQVDCHPRKGKIRTLEFVRALTPDETALTQSFEDLQAQLNSLPRLFFELDGSFLWAGGTEESVGSSDAWRIDAMMYDDGSKVLWCEVKGQLPLAQWEQLLEVLRGQDRQAPLMVLLVRQQKFVRVDELSGWWE